MRKRRRVWLLIVALVLCIAGFAAYIVWDRMNTDITPPQITMDAQEIQVSVVEPTSKLLEGVTAYDNKDGDVTDSIVVESVYGMTSDNRVTVTYSAFDSSNNVTKAQRTVYYTDYESPHFVLTGPLAFEYETNFDVMDYIGAQDVIDGDIRRRIRANLVSGESSLVHEGTHNVQFRVTNSIGDTESIVLPVEVYSNDRYNAELTLTDYLVYLQKGEGFKAENYLGSFTARNKTINTRLPGVEVEISGNVNTQIAGIYPVSYTVKYVENSTTYIGYSKLIVVVEG